MGPLKSISAALALAAAAPASAESIASWRPLIAEASARFGVPETWIRKVMQAESGGRTKLGGRPITSHAGAMGLMQVMPGTYAAMAREHKLGADPHDPRDNILAGTAYLRAMYDRYGYPGLFAAYNAGPGRYEAYLRAARRLPLETRAYVASLTSAPMVRAAQALPQPGAAAEMALENRPAGLFFRLTSRARTPSAARPQEQPSGLFAVIGAADRSED